MTGPERLDLAYFVYGTLRPRYGNSDIWRRLDGRADHDGAAYVQGFRMFGRGIPFAVFSGDPDHRVYGAVIHPPTHPTLASALRRALDGLEGYPDGYDRLITTAHTPDGPVGCWIYSPTRWEPDGEPEPSGNYDNMVTRRRTEV